MLAKTLLQTLVLAYCGVVVAWTGGTVLDAFLRRSALEAVRLIPTMLVKLPMGALVLILPLFFVIVVVSSPIFVLLWLLRRRVTGQIAMMVGAITVLTAFEWAFYQMEWFDVWRHGWPGWAYFIRLVPPSVGFGAAGAIIARAVVARTEVRLTPVGSLGEP